MAATVAVSEAPAALAEDSIEATQTLIAALVLAILVFTQLPLFLRMPLPTDAVLYDIEAARVAGGAVAYQDFFETNLPGALWVHGTVRAIFGPSWLALRMFDAVVFGAVVGLLVNLLRPLVQRTSALMWTAVVLVIYYVSMSEWCHAQRDTWSLLPALGAITLRVRQLRRMTDEAPTGATIGFAVLEGLLWGVAVWLKPMVIVPAAACWLTSTMLVRHPRTAMFDLLGLFVGGVLVGLAGFTWLWSTGAWPAFVDTLTVWNPQYFASRIQGWTSLRVLAMGWRMFPWLLLHMVAVPVAIGQWRAGMRHSDDEPIVADRRTLLAALYLGWVVQSILLQHLFDYVHVPGVLLAITVLAGTRPLERRATRLAVLGFAIVVAASTSLMNAHRLAAWPESVRGPATPELHQNLTLLRQVDWPQLDRVAQYLAAQNVADGQLTCFNSSLVYLYQQLDVQPSTRYAYLDCTLAFCPDSASQVLAEWQASPQRFLVVDLVEQGRMQLGEETTADDSLEPGEFPGISTTEKQTPAFRAGRYAVYAIGA